MNDIPGPTIFPAQPGWNRLWADDENGELIYPDPVIAWEVIPDAYHEPEKHDLPYIISVYPITTEGRAEYSSPLGELFLERPDGIVEAVGDRTWPDLRTANAPEECALRQARYVRHRERTAKASP